MMGAGPQFLTIVRMKMTASMDARNIPAQALKRSRR